MKVELGKEVRCSDKSVGTVGQVLLDAESLDLSQIVVKTGMTGPEKLVPLTLVEAADENGIRLGIDSEQFNHLLAFGDSSRQSPDSLDEASRLRQADEAAAEASMMIPGNEYVPYIQGMPMPESPILATDQPQLPPGQRAIAEGMPVYTTDDEKLGTIADINYDRVDKRVESFEIKSGLIFTSSTVIPADWVGEIEFDRIKLNRTGDQIKDLHDLQEAQHQP